MKKYTEKQVVALNSLNPSSKKDELKQIQVLSPQSLMNDFVCAKLKENVNFRDIGKTDELH